MFVSQFRGSTVDDELISLGSETGLVAHHGPTFGSTRCVCQFRQVKAELTRYHQGWTTYLERLVIRFQPEMSVSDECIGHAGSAWRRRKATVGLTYRYQPRGEADGILQLLHRRYVMCQVGDDDSRSSRSPQSETRLGSHEG